LTFINKVSFSKVWFSLMAGGICVIPCISWGEVDFHNRKITKDPDLLDKPHKRCDLCEALLNQRLSQRMNVPGRRISFWFIGCIWRLEGADVFRPTGPSDYLNLYALTCAHSGGNGLPYVKLVHIWILGLWEI